MKRLILPFVLPVVAVASLVVLPVRASADTAVRSERYYGKVTDVDHAQRRMTVHNARRKADAVFQWDEGTRVISNKKPIPASDLKIGQSLIVSYVASDRGNRAQRITVRAPSKAKRATP